MGMELSSEIVSKLSELLQLKQPKQVIIASAATSDGLVWGWAGERVWARRKISYKIHLQLMLFSLFNKRGIHAHSPIRADSFVLRSPSAARLPNSFSPKVAITFFFLAFDVY